MTIIIHCSDSTYGLPEDCGNDHNSSMSGDFNYFEDKLCGWFIVWVDADTETFKIHI